MKRSLLCWLIPSLALVLPATALASPTATSPAPAAPTAPAPAVAPAPAGPPSFQVIDRGTSVEVIAHNVTAARTGITPIRSRLEVPIVGHPRADRALPTDATVKAVEFDGNDPRVLSVKTGFERTDVKALARYAQAIQVGPDVHMIFPRAIPAVGAVVALPEPTLTPAMVAKVAASTTMAAPAIKPAEVAAVAAAGAVTPVTPVTAVAPAVEQAAPQPAAEAEPKADAISASAAATPAPAAGASSSPGATPAPNGASTSTASSAAAPGKPPTTTAATAQPATDVWQRLSMYGAIGLAAIGCGIWILRRRRAVKVPELSIDVIATKSLGAKAKVVWFSAGGREMVVAVTPQQVRMLGQWKHTGARPQLPSAHALTSEVPVGRQTLRDLRDLPALREARARAAASEDRPSASPAVAGILKLRDRPSIPNIDTRGIVDFSEINDEVATGDLDADALWAKEILAATGARR